MHEHIVTVRTASGAVEGFTRDGVHRWRSIPYARPPVGDLRYRAPQPVQPWSGVRHCHGFGHCSPQQRMYTILAPGKYQPMSEDCLTLNVTTPAGQAGGPLPVKVFIHGGGYMLGSSATPIYDGASLARKGCVYVSVNYRLGALGCLELSSLSTDDTTIDDNLFLRDLVAALRWVQDNIEAFGGDPDNVTIFGESAGGASIYALLATPLANGLFHRAISESTWITTTNVTHLTRHNGFSDSAEARGQQAIADKLTELGRSRNGDPLATMREMTADDIMSMRFSVSLAEDGWVLPKSPDEIFSEGSHNVVPLLAGVNNGEGLFFVRPERTFSTLEEQKQARLEQWGEHGQGLATFYLAKTEDAIFTTEVDYSTDSLFARPNRQILTAMAKTPAETFMYLFTRNLTDPSLRSPHAMELRYVFQTLPGEATETDHSISQLISDYWVQFATTGNPNGDNLPQWPAYDADTQQHQIIGAEVGQGSGFRRQELDELDRYFDATHAGAQP